ncbi:MAG: hypothetical protein ABSE49_03865 [Polyangiaceae bacterium]
MTGVAGDAGAVVGAAGAAAGSVAGAATTPLMAAFCFAPFVPRASRVALPWATAWALLATVWAPRGLGGS